MSRYLRERAQLKNLIRSYFEDRGFLEIDTPILVKTPGAEIHLDYFPTEWIDHQGNPHTFYLRSSPEIHMKRAVANGYGPVFQLAPSFRNGGEYSDWHHPEFTMLEWYHPGADLRQLIQETSELLYAAVNGLSSRRLPVPIPVFSVADLFRKHTKLDPFASDFLAKARATRLTNINQFDDHDSAFFKIMLDIIEPELRRYPACFVEGYPSSTASLAKIKNGVAQRVELYLDGIEVANGFDELAGTKENLDRMIGINQKRKELAKSLPPVDQQFATDMDQLGTCSGNALGFDRLLAWILQLDSIDDIIPFRNKSSI